MKHLIPSSHPARIELRLYDLKTSDQEAETSRILLVVSGVCAALLGIWGLACLISGSQTCEDLIDMGRMWLYAVTGA